jgi:cytochrome c
MRIWILTAALIMTSTASAHAQDAKAGEAVFKKYCSPCHDVGPDVKAKLGPPLNGLDGRKAGTFPGYNYSQANKSSGITWQKSTFTQYIENPMQRIPGTRMAFAGIRNKKDIANLWTYLSQFDGKGNVKK